MTHAFAGVSRAIRYKFNAYTRTDIINHTLKIFGNGVKVACEISMMAADAGLVRTHEADIIAVAVVAAVLIRLSCFNLLSLRIFLTSRSKKFSVNLIPEGIFKDEIRQELENTSGSELSNMAAHPDPVDIK